MVNRSFVLLVLAATLLLMVLSVASWVYARSTLRPPDPFAAYASVMPGSPRSAIIAKGFFCDRNSKSGVSEYCKVAPSEGPFSTIDVVLFKDTVTTISFIVRKRALNAGDMALLWGRPRIELYHGSVIFLWPDAHAGATGISSSERFTYFFPLTSIRFSMSIGNRS